MVVSRLGFLNPQAGSSKGLWRTGQRAESAPARVVSKLPWQSALIKPYLYCLNSQEADLIRLKRDARKKDGFYVEPEAKLLFVMRLRGLNDLHPKTRHIMKLLRLRQIHNGVFMRVSV